LIVKVARISERKLPPGAERDKTAMVSGKVERLRMMLEDIVDHDTNAYSNLVRLKVANTKGMASDESVERALKTATLIPGAMGRAALLCVNLAREIVHIAFGPALADLAMGSWLCYAATEASIMAVEYNLNQIKDQEFCSKIHRKLGFFDNRNDTLQHIIDVVRGERQQRV
jgi:formiminotetrahydrofolate cyclodeaminase